MSFKTAVSACFRDERGSLTIFSLFMILVMLAVGGMAYDLLRFETERKRMQATLDQAILAATNLRQREDSKAIVKSFMAKQGFDPDAVQVSIKEELLSDEETIVSRTVSASTRIETGTIFMRMLGVDTLSGGTGSTANEEVQHVEISLVLDISGSMRFGGDYNRIAALRDAVDSFVDVVLDVRCDSEGKNCVQNPDSYSTTINVIPYAGHVNPGPDLFEYLEGSRWHGWSSCLEVGDADFDNTRLPSSDKRQLAHFMKWDIAAEVMDWGWCPTNNAGIMFASNNAAQIKSFVRNIRMHDGTATHVGMKYGVALLDPSSRDAFGFLADRGQIAEDYRKRPADYTDRVVKHLVVMTDGGTTDSHRPKEAVRQGDDDNDESKETFDYDDIYSIDPDEWGPFLVEGEEPDDPSDEWEHVMDRFGSRDSAGEFNDAADVEWGYPKMKTFVDSSGVKHKASKNNDNLLDLCTLAKAPITLEDGTKKANRIIVYSVAFLTDDGPADLMAKCASTKEKPHFWRVRDKNAGLETAFKSIAYTINQLRLTQ
ncbi:MAG: pilus assembly protein TadG-related protein [Pseudomonadota bacterium]